MARKKAYVPAMVEPVLPPSLPDGVIDEVVAAVNDLGRRTGIEFALGVGQLIVDNFYDGDLSLWRERGTKDASFRKLATRPGLQLSAPALYRCVAAYDLCMRIGVSTWKHLGLSHFRTVFGLPESAQQALLFEAEREGWTVDKLAETVRLVKRPKDTRGRPPLPRFVKTVNKFARLLEDPDNAFGDLEQIAHLEVDEAHALYDTVDEMRRRCQQIQEQLQRTFVGFD